MTTYVQTLVSSSKTVLSNRGQLVTFLLLLPVITALLYLIPVVSIPGNDVAFQLTLFTQTDFIILLTIAALESLLLVMLLHLFRDPHRKIINRNNLGVISGAPAFLFGTNFCPMCILAIFGVFGPGVVGFLVRYQYLFFAISASVLLVSLYSTSRKIQDGCELCL